MRFEKLNDDKIRITLTHQDLLDKDIDFHSFMSNSIESQDLFFDVLDEAKDKIGFDTKDYLIKIEALAMSGGDFILTITRTLPDSNKKGVKKRVNVRRKKMNFESSQVIYLFYSFEDFCNFVEFFDSSFSNLNIAKNITLYNYRNTYYLLFDNINLNYPNLKRFFSSITEFGSFVNNSDLFMKKLIENGNVIIKHNAIKTAIKYFVH